MISLEASQLLTLPRKAGAQTRVPPLENGAHLSAAEFMRRYEAMPREMKAELIQGKVYMASPLRAEQHGDPDNLAQGWLCNYMIATPGVKSSTNSTTILDDEDIPQPDSHLRILPECGGQTAVNQDGYVEGAPELIFEIAASSASIDTNEKKDSYRDAKTREYIVWRTEEHSLDWWVLQDGEYVEIDPDEDGILRSRVFPGLWMDGKAMLLEDGPNLMEALQRGLASPEHTQFVEKLAAARAKTEA